jgi:hypothetical protein
MAAAPPKETSATHDRPSTCELYSESNARNCSPWKSKAGTDNRTLAGRLRRSHTSVSRISVRGGKPIGDNDILSRPAMWRRNGAPRAANAFIEVGYASPLRQVDERRKTGPNNPLQPGAGFQLARGSLSPSTFPAHLVCGSKKACPCSEYHYEPHNKYATEGDRLDPERVAEQADKMNVPKGSADYRACHDKRRS